MKDLYLTSDKKPLVGVSRCLLGDAVRYDGKSKTNQIVLQQLDRIFKLIAVCPEVEAGLTVPRPPVQLTTSITNPRLIGRDDASVDITDVMQNYCNRKTAELKPLAGFVFKSRSPSCGLNSTPVFINGDCVTQTGRGIFAQTLCTAYPDLAVIEDCELENKTQLNKFIQSVLIKCSS